MQVLGSRDTHYTMYIFLNAVLWIWNFVAMVQFVFEFDYKRISLRKSSKCLKSFAVVRLCTLKNLPVI